jgi:polysaccharide export outer membrane protein
MEAGDVLVIEPNDYNGPIRLQSDQTVQQDGTIDLGSYGSVYVAGHSTKEIQARIETAVRNVELAKRNRRNQRTALASYDGNMATTDEDLDLSVSVRMVHQESSSVYVMGEVNAPGSYPIDGNETVLDAIISAGGLSGKSNDRKIILTRPQLGGKPRVVLPVCFQHILQLGDVSTNYQLQPGDRIYVPSMNLLEDIRQSMRWRRDKSCPYCVNGSE